MICKNVKLLFFFLLVWVGKMNAAKSEKPDYIQFAHEIMDTFAYEMKEQYDLQPFGDGGQMPYDVEAIIVKFISFRKATLEQARELEVRATERLLEIINSHEKIRPFLREYPFKSFRAEVSITFLNTNNKRYTDGSVAHVSQINGKIYYDRAEPQTIMLIEIAQEPYEEALKIVQSSPPSFGITSLKKRV